MKQAVLSLSGGMDSSTLLLHLLANDYKVIDNATDCIIEENILFLLGTTVAFIFDCS